MTKLRDYPNIGKEVEKQLNAVGIYTMEQLKKVGAEQAWLKIKKKDHSACLHRLLALEGAIRGIKKSLIDTERKNELKNFSKLNEVLDLEK
ncbi:TfoX/Sxy family protein [Enterococcus faecium]|uniref:TfoX/Sxy family protein n=1 Tax=Enterococcus faecium TaxID=1352 RepID=UPI001920BAD6|nr:TfoX/Sxy family protein [Enterococcus faecium]EGP4893633.1 TfoX/Sxy family protein [Enterococcus faecium]EGP5600651.1 competence protein TfoX [Enterococcus faecium]EHK9937688.1 TfoX/Sxy family protein [Enterococcus faecium]EME7159951.1 TfoX/Sxy family protein [Enterococcus faecium]MBL3708769.1 competence protein TfoX [Enterococcus faecium]